MSMRKELLESAKEVAERSDLAGYLVIGWNQHESASIRSNGNVPRSLITIVSRDIEGDVEAVGKVEKALHPQPF